MYCSLRGDCGEAGADAASAVDAVLLIIYKIQIHIRIGEESFEHANVLSEKINFSALGGPGVAIFGPDDLHPMY